MSNEMMSIKEAVILFFLVLVVATIIPLLFVPTTDWIYYFRRPIMEILSAGTPYYITVEIFAFFAVLSWRAIN